MGEIRMEVRFHGRVQGVGFRYRAKYLAQSLGLRGWVRNEWDGTVSMEVQGNRQMIDKLFATLNQDRYIRIDWMESDEIPLKQEKGFSVR